MHDFDHRRVRSNRSAEGVHDGIHGALRYLRARASGDEDPQAAAEAIDGEAGQAVSLSVHEPECIRALRRVRGRQQPAASLQGRRHARLDAAALALAGRARPDPCSQRALPFDARQPAELARRSAQRHQRARAEAAGVAGLGVRQNPGMSAREGT